MRKILLGLAVTSTLAGCATIPAGTQPMTSYQEIVEIPNTSKDSIYEGSRQWVAKTFRSANSVIQYQDKKTGSIIGKGSVPHVCQGLECLSATPATQLQFTLQVDAKDNKARVSFDDLNLHTPSYFSGLTRMPETNYKLYSESQKQRTKTLLSNITKSLSDDITSTSKNSDW